MHLPAEVPPNWRELVLRRVQSRGPYRGRAGDVADQVQLRKIPLVKSESDDVHPDRLLERHLRILDHGLGYLIVDDLDASNCLSDRIQCRGGLVWQAEIRRVRRLRVQPRRLT